MNLTPREKDKLLISLAAMVARGAFKDLPAGDAGALVYWKLTGGPKPKEGHGQARTGQRLHADRAGRR